MSVENSSEEKGSKNKGIRSEVPDGKESVDRQPEVSFESSCRSVVESYLSLKQDLEADLQDNFPEEQFSEELSAAQRVPVIEGRIERKYNLFKRICLVSDSVAFHSDNEQSFSKDQRGYFIRSLYDADNTYLHTLSSAKGFVGYNLQHSLGVGFVECLHASCEQGEEAERIAMQQRAMLHLSRIANPDGAMFVPDPLVFIRDRILEDNTAINVTSQQQLQAQRSGRSFDEVFDAGFVDPIFASGRRFLTSFEFITSPSDEAFESVRNEPEFIQQKIKRSRDALGKLLKPLLPNVLCALAANEKNLSTECLRRLRCGKERENEEGNYMSIARDLAEHDFKLRQLGREQDVSTVQFFTQYPKYRSGYLDDFDRKELLTEYEIRARRRGNQEEMDWARSYKERLVEDGVVFDREETSILKSFRLFEIARGKDNLDLAQFNISDALRVARSNPKHKVMKMRALEGSVLLCSDIVARDWSKRSTALVRSFHDEREAILEFAGMFSLSKSERRRGFGDNDYLLTPNTASVVVSKLMSPFELEILGRTRGRRDQQGQFDVELTKVDYREDYWKACNVILDACQRKGWGGLNINNRPVPLATLRAQNQEKLMRELGRRKAEKERESAREAKVQVSSEVDEKAREAFLRGLDEQYKTQKSKRTAEIREKENVEESTIDGAREKVEAILERQEERLVPVVAEEQEPVKPYIMQFRKIRMFFSEKNYEGALGASEEALRMAESVRRESEQPDRECDEYLIKAAVEAAGYCNIIGFRMLRKVMKRPSKDALDQAIGMLRKGSEYLNIASDVMSHKGVEFPALNVDGGQGGSFEEDRPELAQQMKENIDILRQDVDAIAVRSNRLFKEKQKAIDEGREAAQEYYKSIGREWKQGLKRGQISEKAMERLEIEGCLQVMGDFIRDRGVVDEVLEMVPPSSLSGTQHVRSFDERKKEVE